MSRFKECPECDGSGWVDEPLPFGLNPNKLVCSDCDGTGEIEVESEDEETV